MFNTSGVINRHQSTLFFTLVELIFTCDGTCTVKIGAGLVVECCRYQRILFFTQAGLIFIYTCVGQCTVKIGVGLVVKYCPSGLVHRTTFNHKNYANPHIIYYIKYFNSRMILNFDVPSIIWQCHKSVFLERNRITVIGFTLV